MKWIIKRSKWLRGVDSLQSRLLRDDGLMCCIGQVCSQLGVPDEKLFNITCARDIFTTGQSPLTHPTGDGTNTDKAWVRLAYEVNDDVSIIDSVRERKLEALAAENGHSFEFVD